jgi:hypothetical protein
MAERLMVTETNRPVRFVVNPDDPEGFIDVYMSENGLVVKDSTALVVVPLTANTVLIEPRR